MGKRKRKGLPFCSREEEMARLQVEELVGLDPIKLPHEVARDAKRLARFLENLEGTINKLIIGVKQHQRLIARELVIRPTYLEEAENLRDNLNQRI